MKLREILTHYDATTLESLAADKIDDVIHLRLPTEVLIDEIANTIASFSYVSEAIASRHPPYFEILDLLIKAEDHAIEVRHLKSAVRERTAEIVAAADGEDALALNKEYDLYTRMLESAWANDMVVDASESSMLTALRRELGISFREHIVLEHGARVREFWKTPDAYERERNHLLTAGLLHSIDDRYVLPEELPPLIRQVWSIELPQENFRRLLIQLSNERLYELLHEYRLKVSGTKNEKIDRLVSNYVEPRDLLDRIALVELRDVARDVGARISGTKDEVIDNLIEFFRRGEDLKEEETPEPEPIEPEPKALAWEDFDRLFHNLTVENIYEIADKLDGIPKSGSKRERIAALWESPYSEVTLLGSLTNAILVKILKQLALPVSGPKDEKIARLVDWITSRPETTRERTEDESIMVIEDEEGDSGIEQVPDWEATRVPGQPAGLRDIESKFPFLDESQQLVLAVLHELRSLNESELERLIARYDLDWFLMKAEMMNLVERLEENDTPVVQIQARGDHNIYEYVGA